MTMYYHDQLGGFLAGRKILFVNSFRLFSHESKVRNLNYHLNCAFWITQCTHERSNFDIWITQCTHERPNLGFCIPEREKNVRVPCQSNMHRTRISCASVHMQCAVYRRKWLEGHLGPPPKSQLRGQGIHTVIWLRDLRDAYLENTSGPSFEMRISNDASRCNLAYTWSKIQSFKF